MVESVKTQIGNQLRIVGIEAGMHLTGLLPDDLDDVSISRRASAVAVSTIPLSNCFLSRPLKMGLVLGYGSVDETPIERGVSLLSAILRADDLLS